MPSDISLGTSRFLFSAHFLRRGALLTFRFLSCTQVIGFSYSEHRLENSLLGTDLHLKKVGLEVT